MTEQIVVFTDGSGLGNPNGAMGWAWADQDPHGDTAKGHHHPGITYAHGGANRGTNQIGELCAVLEALRAHPGAETLVIHSDSQYAIKCSTVWLKSWKKNGWKNSKKQTISNLEIVQAIDAEISHREGNVEFVWVKGHSGDAGNELCDQLAKQYATDCKTGAAEGQLPIEGWQSLINSPYNDNLHIPSDIQLQLNRSRQGNQNSQSNQTSQSTSAHHNNVPDTTVNKQQSSQTDTPAHNQHTSQAGITAHNQRISRSADHALMVDTDDITVDSTTGEVIQHNTHPAPPSSASQSSTITEETSQQITPLAPLAERQAYYRRGLTVNADIAFTPQPRQNPNYQGNPIRVEGRIEISGYVTGDGVLHLENLTLLPPQAA